MKDPPKLTAAESKVNIYTGNLRVDSIISWVEKNKDLINSSKIIQIVLHIKGINIRGEVCVFPDCKE